MDEPIVPPALVLGCNTPHGIGVLSDWIEERAGTAFDFADAGWSDHNWSENGYGDIGERYTVSNGRGDGYGYAFGYGHGDGNGSGDGFGFGYSYGEYSGNGDGCGFGYDYGMWFGEGTGYGLYADGYIFGANTNPSFWHRIGQRLRQLIR